MTKLLGFEIFDGSKREYMEQLITGYKRGSKVVVVSGNPEILYIAYKNEKLKKMFQDYDIIPDGIGVIIGGMITGQKFCEKIAGIEVFCELLSLSGKTGSGIYMLGAEKDILEKAVVQARQKYNANIAGYHDGYFDIDDCQDIIDDIDKSGADILIVAMGCPRQELFIEKCREKVGCRIFMGVGGSFDVLAGKVSRAPRWMIRCGLEWLYRVFKEPKRILRLLNIPKFLTAAVFKRR